MVLQFPTAYNDILEKIEQVDPINYGRTRNYINGAVTCLSPYISRGVITTRQLFQTVLKKGYKLHEIQPFVKELCWRDYFQRVGQVKNVNEDIKQRQYPVLNDAIPAAVLDARTGIEGIDSAIQQLYNTGYMHNHCRMYTASIICNIAKSHWHLPSQWMYYHLLDGDWSSNACSWQWVAGANSNKKYYATQENINKYTLTNQANTYLDTSYEAISAMETPAELSVMQPYMFIHELPDCAGISVDAGASTFIYNYYNLDPQWHKDEPGNRILLLEPAFFSSYPVSKKCIDFILALGKNIKGLQVYVGSFESLVTQYNLKNIYFKEHPLNIGYKGTKDQRDWMVSTVSGYYPSFFAYWKQIEKHLGRVSLIEKYTL